MLACLFVCSVAWLFVCVRVVVSLFARVRLPACVPFLLPYLFVGLLVCSSMCGRVCLLVCLLACLRAPVPRSIACLCVCSLG